MIQEQIKSKRESIGLSQNQLAEKIGVKQQWIAQIETGLRMPSLNNLMSMAKIFNCSIDELVEMDKFRKE